MKHLGTGIAITGIWCGSALAIKYGAESGIFFGTAVTTGLVAFCSIFWN